ncbi:MAG: TVP38/TMEM64 family protein [Caulobacterales bacterium]
MSEQRANAQTQLSRITYVVGFAVLGAVTLIGFAAPLLPDAMTAQFQPWLVAAKTSLWAPFAAILAYVLFASVGVPQIVLITALVAAFGPWAGLAYSWTGKMIACCIGFFAGRRFGAQIVARHASPRVAEVMQVLARRGFIASALIRMVPTVPSVLVNIAAGATPMRFLDFLAGTAIGSVPKMALMAFGGAAAMDAVHHNSMTAWIVLGAVILLWLALAYAGRRWLNRRTPD